MTEAVSEPPVPEVVGYVAVRLTCCGHSTIILAPVDEAIGLAKTLACLGLGVEV